MRRLGWTAAAAALALAAWSPAAAYTGTKFLRMCAAPEGSVTYVQDVSSCIAYIHGVRSGWNVAEQYIDVRTGMFCIPSDVTLGALREVVVASLRAYPEELDGVASLSVMVAPRDAYPC